MSHVLINTSKDTYLEMVLNAFLVLSCQMIKGLDHPYLRIFKKMAKVSLPVVTPRPG